MKEFFKILKRFIPPYKERLILNFLFNLLSALFTVFSMVLLSPILEILFGMSEDVNEFLPWAANLDIIKNNLYYYVTLFKQANGPGLTLLFVGIFVIIATMLKVGFAYLGAFQAVYIRNGVVRDMREQIYSKMLKLALPFFSEERKGDIISRITGDVTEVENSIMSSLDMFLKNPIIIFVLLASMLDYEPEPDALLFFMVLPIAGFIIGRVGKSLKKVSREGQDKMGMILTVVEETLGWICALSRLLTPKKRWMPVSILNFTTIATS
jgi:ATP-binding cassette, subfamily B, bacterial MsbA